MGFSGPPPPEVALRETQETVFLSTWQRMQSEQLDHQHLGATFPGVGRWGGGEGVNRSPGGSLWPGHLGGDPAVSPSYGHQGVELLDQSQGPSRLGPPTPCKGSQELVQPTIGPPLQTPSSAKLTCRRGDSVQDMTKHSLCSHFPPSIPERQREPASTQSCLWAGAMANTAQHTPQRLYPPVSLGGGTAI